AGALAGRREQRARDAAGRHSGAGCGRNVGPFHAGSGDQRHRTARRGERGGSGQDRHRGTGRRAVARLVHRLRAVRRGGAQDRVLGVAREWSVRRYGGRAGRGGDCQRGSQNGSDPAMSLFSEIEKTIERGFHRFAERMFGPADSNELLLLHRAILAEVEGKVQIVARGRRVFPFARMVVTLVAAEAERRTILQAAFGERLEADIRAGLAGSECELPRGFSVEVRTAEAGLRAFEIEYSAKPAKAAAPPAPATIGRVIVVKGKTASPEYTLERVRTNIGRMPELTDTDHRVVRRNDVVFEEGADES